MYTYIERERERDRNITVFKYSEHINNKIIKQLTCLINIYIYIYVYIYIYILMLLQTII